MLLLTGLHSPLRALSDDVVLRVLPTTEWRTRGIVLEQGILNKVTAYVCPILYVHYSYIEHFHFFTAKILNSTSTSLRWSSLLRSQKL